LKNLKRRDDLEGLHINEMIILKWGKIQYEDVDWINLAQHKVQWYVPVNVAITIQG
jgi:hypothetical protein